MEPRDAYRQQYSPGWTRVDMLLAMFDGAIERLEMAAASLRQGDRVTALRLLTRAEVIVCELAAGVDLDYAHAREFLRLYGIVSRAIALATLADTVGALGILRAMREGLSDLREEASRLERDGVLPPAAATHLSQTSD
jgi:flagellar secretion chaperone FliS